MNWIIKPNKWYDRLEEPNRMLLFLGVMIFLLVGFWLINLGYVGMTLWSLLGLYRISYFIIMDTKRLIKKES